MDPEQVIPRPAPSGGRLARDPRLTAALVARLTARDRWLLRMLLEYRVLTTTQITDLAFGTTRAATARLLTLYQHRAVDRFRPLAPPGTGSMPLHFVLDDAGAAVLAAEDATTPAALGYRRDRALAIALSPTLAHATGANGIFTSLAAAARASNGTQVLQRWWSERRCTATWGEHTRPDGYGRWLTRPPGTTSQAAMAATDFFLEGFDFAASPKLPAAQIRDLAALRWLQADESVILYGPVGVGKSHVAQALGHLAVRHGAAVRFLKTSRALAHLAGGRADSTGTNGSASSPAPPSSSWTYPAFLSTRRQCRPAWPGLLFPHVGVSLSKVPHQRR